MEAPFSHELSCTGLLENDYSQLWKLEKHTSGKWNLKNVLTGRYIKTQGGELSRIYETTTSSNSRFSLEDGNDDYLPVYSFVDGNGIGLHCDARGRVVGWDASIATSQWMLRTATVDETALKAAQDKLAEYAALTEQANVARLRATMQAYFEDLACTKLKAQYQAMSDADLTTLMSTTPTDQTGAIKMALPPFVQEMVLKVKNNTWGHREKEFRIYDYKPYSDHTQWNSTKLVGTGAGSSDGQVLVVDDMLGKNNGFSPKFLRRYADLHTIMTNAIGAYVADVKSGDFPNASEQY